MAAEPRDWTSPQNDGLWRDELKTLFDPCPAGWRVPKSGPDEAHLWSAFSVDNCLWEGAMTGNDASAGRRYGAGSAYPIWFPADGNRNAQNGMLRNIAWEITHWTTSIVQSVARDLVSNSNNWYLGSGCCAYALPVRCIRE